MIIKRNGARLPIAEGSVRAIGFNYRDMRVIIDVPMRGSIVSVQVSITELELRAIVDAYRKERGDEALV